MNIAGTLFTIMIIGFIAMIKASTLGVIDLDEFIDDQFRTTTTPTSSQEVIHSISKATLDFVLFSLQIKTIIEPISILSIQFCFVKTLKHLIFQLESENLEDYNLFLDRFSLAIKSDHIITEIFTTSSIDRLTRILRKSSIIFEGLKSDNEYFDAGMREFLLGLKWAAQEISSLETFEFSDFLQYFINDNPPVSADHLPFEIYHKLCEFKTETESISTFQVLLLIQDRNIPNIPNIFNSDSSGVFEFILKISEFEIRKLHDFKVQFPMDQQHCKSDKKISIDILQDNLKRISKVKVNSSNFSKIKTFIEEIVSLSPPLICKEEIDLIAYLIQETKHLLIRDPDWPGQFKEINGNALEFMTSLMKFLKSLINAEEMDRFLDLFHDFLSKESLENILRLSRKFNNLSSIDELVYCIELGLKGGDFPNLKEYIFHELFDIKEEISPFYVNPWLTIGDGDEADDEREDDFHHNFFNENESLRINCDLDSVGDLSHSSALWIQTDGLSQCCCSDVDEFERLRFFSGDSDFESSEQNA